MKTAFLALLLLSCSFASFASKAHEDNRLPGLESRKKVKKDGVPADSVDNRPYPVKPALPGMNLEHYDHSRNPHIFNGTDANEAEFPFMAKLFSAVAYENGAPSYGYSCGGSIIGRRWILTAAHCVCDEDREVFNPADVYVTVGDHSDYTTGSNERRMRVISVNVYAGYNDINYVYDYYEPALDNDIAILELDQELSWNSAVDYVNLPAANDDSQYAAGTKVMVIGWGMTDVDEGLAVTLQKLQTDFVSYEDCRDQWENWGADITYNMICTGNVPNNGYSLPGDSGGPLFGLVKDSNGRPTQYAAVSWGSTSPDRYVYTVNARVDQFIQWIEDIQNDANGTSAEHSVSSSSGGTWYTHAINRYDNHRITITPAADGYASVNIKLNSYLQYTARLYVAQGNNYLNAKLLGMLGQYNGTYYTYEFTATEKNTPLYIVALAGDSEYVYGGAWGTYGNYSYEPSLQSSAGEDGELYCAYGYFACKDRRKCILEEYKCDGYNQCFDGSDEGDTCTTIDFDGSFSGDLIWDIRIDSLEVDITNVTYNRGLDLYAYLGYDNSYVDYIHINVDDHGIYWKLYSCHAGGYQFIESPFNGSKKLFYITFNEEYLSLVDAAGTPFFNQAYNAKEMTYGCMNSYSNMTNGVKVYTYYAQGTLKVVDKITNDGGWTEPEKEVSPDADYSEYSGQEWETVTYGGNFKTDGNDTQFFVPTDTRSYTYFYNGYRSIYSYLSTQIYGSTEHTFWFSFQYCETNTVMVDKPEADSNGYIEFTYDFARTSSGDPIFYLRAWGKEIWRVEAIDASCREVLELMSSADTTVTFYASTYSGEDMFTRVLGNEEPVEPVEEWQNFGPEEGFNYDWNLRNQSVWIDFYNFRDVMEQDLTVGLEVYFDDNALYTYYEKGQLLVKIEECMTKGLQTIQMPENFNGSAIYTFYRSAFQIVSAMDGKVMYELDYDEFKESCGNAYYSSSNYAVWYTDPFTEGRLITINKVAMQGWEYRPELTEDQEYDDKIPFEELLYSSTVINRTAEDLQYLSTYGYVTYTYVRDNYGGLINNATIMHLRYGYDWYPQNTINLFIGCENRRSWREIYIEEDMMLDSNGTTQLTYDFDEEAIYVRLMGKEVYKVTKEQGRYCEDMLREINNRGKQFQIYNYEYGDSGVEFMPVKYRLVPDEHKKEMDYELMLWNPEDIMDKSMGVVYVKSLVEAHNDGGESEVGMLCNAGIGRNEANAMCRYFGFRYGMSINVFDFKGLSKRNNPFDEMRFFATDIMCPPDASVEDCEYAEYEEMEVPCEEGEQVALKCADMPFEMNAELSVTKTNRNKSKFMCYVEALKYGQEYDTKKNFEAMFLSRDSNGYYSVIHAEPKFKKGGFFAKESTDGMDECFLCISWVKESNLWTMSVNDDECSYAMDKEQIWDEIFGHDQDTDNLFAAFFA